MGEFAKVKKINKKLVRVKCNTKNKRIFTLIKINEIYIHIDAFEKIVFVHK